MELLYILLVILIVTRTLGELAERVGLPILVGELLGGVILGTLAARFSHHLPILSELPDNKVFKGITDLGMFFLMLLAGLELRPRDLAKGTKVGFAVAIGGVVAPFLLGALGCGLLLPESDFRWGQAFFLGVALSITAVPVSVKVLMDINELHSRIGRTIVAAAIIDDILSLVLLAALTAFLKQGALPGAGEFFLIAGRTFAFFLFTWVMGRYCLPFIGKRVRSAKTEEFEFSFLLIIALGFSVVAELLHIHFILGAFAAGLFFVRDTINEKVYDDVFNKMSGLTTGFFAPVFFASIGFHLNLEAIHQIPWFVLALVVLATIGKLVGSAVPARMCGIPARESLAVGVGMNARGAVELIVADIALRAGLFSQPEPPPPIVAYMFSAVVIMAVVTTLSTPLILKPLLAGRGAEESRAQDPAE